ncbi:hypothetical protein [Candidatus Methylospira mobilis]
MAGAAEGKVVANLFAPAGDWDVPAGFAKNGDTLLGISPQKVALTVFLVTNPNEPITFFPTLS